MSRLKEFGSFALLDGHLHWKMLMSQVAWSSGLPFIYYSASHDQRFSAIIFIIVIILQSSIELPLRIIGRDRSKGTMWLLVSLPVTRLGLAIIKWLEVLALTSAISIVSFVILELFAVFTTQTALQWLIYTYPITAALTLIATGLSFLLSDRVVRGTIGGLLLAGFAAVYSHVQDLALTNEPLSYAGVATAMVGVGVLIFVASIRAWSLRSLPT